MVLITDAAALLETRSAARPINDLTDLVCYLRDHGPLLNDDVLVLDHYVSDLMPLNINVVRINRRAIASDDQSICTVPANRQAVAGRVEGGCLTVIRLPKLFGTE